MGARNTDRVHISEYRSKADTIADMWKLGWRVRSVCETCGAQRQENLDAMIRLRGPGLVLWDKTGVCQQISMSGICKGRLFYKGLPPGAQRYDYLGSMPRPQRPSYGPQSNGKGAFVELDEIEPPTVTAARGHAPPPEDAA